MSSKKQLPEQYRHEESVGTEIRFNHEECGDAKERLYVQRTDRGWKHHCHNCAPKMSGFTHDKTPSASKTLQRVSNLLNGRADSDDGNDVVRLPDGYTDDLPLEALLWLYQYNLTDEEIEDYQIGYDKSTDRIILPWFDKNGELLWYQGRALNGHSKFNPKYMHVGPSNYAILANRECPGKATVVEDLISAIKVARFTTAVCLFGSFMSAPLYRELGENYAKVNIWLDQDKMCEAFKYARRLRYTQDIPVNVIATRLDPKECQDRIIKAHTCYTGEGVTQMLESV